jgi:site-specific DNA-methyltransferase (adenine-specific)
MSNYKIYNQDVLDWSREYNKIKFHALLCDPPYFLDTIMNRYGNMTEKSTGIVADRINNRSDGLARLASGFLGQSWDTDVAMNPETWKMLKTHLYPGALCMAYSHSRLYHKMASAIEDAGFIIYPIIGWINGQGFPHPTKSNHEGYYYNRNALKGSLEPICIFQNSYEGSMKDTISKYGTGMWNINGGRIKGEPIPINKLEKWSGFGEIKSPAYTATVNTDGRWPANVLASEDYDLPFDKFFYQAKPNKKEKNLGLDGNNPHATIKPIDLNRYLATLLLPPDMYAPRNLLVPFSGVGSEMIGGLLAGWDRILGIEKDTEQEYVDIAYKRLKHYEDSN